MKTIKDNFIELTSFESESINGGSDTNQITTTSAISTCKPTPTKCPIVIKPPVCVVRPIVCFPKFRFRYRCR